MGRHKDWRKVAKRERRRKIRTKAARELDSCPSPSCSEYTTWLKEQELLERFELEQIEFHNKKENEKWIEAEIIAIEKYRRIQEEKEKQNQIQLENELKIKQELELEKQRKAKEAERLKEIEEENKKRQEQFMSNLEKFLSGDCSDPPQELLIYHETRPNTELCPFFIKTACCRFGDQCSRNHQYPGISKILLATNFYIHFGLENANYNEYDTDIMLEYEDSETLRDYREFFYDVLPEFQKLGEVVEFKVCNNYEKHLRGNTYIEYADLRSAVKAYRTLHARWYGGRQMSLQFCQIPSWKAAICGLQSRKRCPKGRACNFLHVFSNPEKFFRRNYSTERRRRTPPRSWRWSESPEREIIKRKRSRSKDRRDTKIRRKRRHSKRIRSDS
ncbi:U2 small nuclear ribonucleoprotein auxiliary factor 35 kDa subunit-related protein 2 [Pieris rapae]|uniref:U2 small nuclear ribonucleoprotein auxiliary factor 35 kDa subunit-related protein 2 n=1 Tax=Pieris rapae TaxID=64459 RepID=UPI001E27D898|nr:U2 small nuclear ribonucleoprotein auxiliary factor 35 kDa subunit-related protein 2 [Pieris rapae]